ncbi:MAG: BACON domain-containing protein [Candidatus Cryptobacteroides sp.]
MNIMNRSVAFTVLASLFVFSSCVKEEINPNLRRDTDVVNIAYNEGATATVTVRYNGQWYAVSDTDWLTVTPDQTCPESGNGTDFQKVTITASRNAGEKRTGYIRILSSNGTYNASVEVNQADGSFEVKEPSLTGALTKDDAASAAIVIKYTKAKGGEKITVRASIEGDGALSIAPETVYTVPAEGDGSLTIPVEGTASILGEVTVTCNVTVDGKELYNTTMTSNVLSPDIVYLQTFDKMVFGGDYPNNLKGIGVDGAQTYEWYAPKNRWTEMSKLDQDGTFDVFGDSNTSWASHNIEGYRQDRGIDGWNGEKVYEHPGYIKVGTGSAAGWFQLPALSSLDGETTVTLTMKLLRFDNTDGTIEITTEGGGEVTGGVLTPENFPAQKSAAERKWTVRSFRIDGATSNTRIKVSAQNSTNVKTTRFNVDSIVVSTSVVKLTEPLADIDPAELKTYPTENSIKVEWPAVKGADAYAVTLYSAASPNFKYTLETDGTQCTFDSIPAGVYVFEITAISYVQPEFNSQTTTKKIGTAGQVTEKLASPTGLAISVNGRNVVGTWNAVSGCSLYKASIYSTDSQDAVSSQYVTTNTVTFPKLTPEKTYYYKVQAVVSQEDANEFDSDEVTSEQVFIELPTLKAEIVFVNESQYGIKWTLKDYNNFDFDHNTTYTLATFKDEACTKLHSRHYFTAKASIFSSNRTIPYKVSPQFMVSGLDADKDYWVTVAATAFDIEQTVKVHTGASKVVTMPTSTASAGDVILYEDFSEWPFGGECVQGFPGWSLKSTGTAYENYMALGDDPIGDGSKLQYFSAEKHSGLMNTFKWHVPNTRIKDWGNVPESNAVGALCMAAGLVKIGASSACAQIVTPAITCLSGTAEVEVSFDACPYMDPSTAGKPYKFDPATCIVQVYNNSARKNESGFINHEVGTPSETEVHKFRMPTTDDDYKWVRYTYTVTVSNGDAIGIGSYRDDADSENTNKQRRMYIDNIQLKVLNYK